MTFFTHFIRLLGWLFVVGLVLGAMSAIAAVVAHPHLWGVFLLVYFLDR